MPLTAEPAGPGAPAAPAAPGAPEIEIDQSAWVPPPPIAFTSITSVEPPYDATCPSMKFPVFAPDLAITKSPALNARFASTANVFDPSPIARLVVEVVQKLAATATERV